jgi:probable rRNA maturation factor
MLKKQAKMYQHSIADEFTILVVHGIVHMMGFEHEGVNEQEKLLMQKHEKNILSRVGLSPDF